MNEIEYDSDEEIEQKPSIPKCKQPGYTTVTRDVSSKKFKKEETTDQVRVEEYDSDDEAYANMLKSADDEEDDFARQLRLEKEEQERIKAESEKKTKTDPDGTEYEWDPVVKGWFPKIADKQFLEYQQQNYVPTEAAAANYDRKLLENKFFRLVDFIFLLLHVPFS